MFSEIKLGIVLGTLVVISSLTAGIFYYRAEYKGALADNNTLIAQVKVLQVQATQLKSFISDQKNRVDTYVTDNAYLAKKNNETAMKLQESEAKMAHHRLLKLRNSAQAERVLRIINRSTAKEIAGYMAQ